MKSNKKSQFFNIFLAFGTIAILFMALFWLSPISWNNSIGKRQFDIIEAYQAKEKNLMYIDQSAKLAVYKTLDTISSKGGFYSEQYSCGKTSRDYFLWNTNDKNISECFPFVQRNFENKFKDNLNFYLEGQKDLKNLLNKYEISLVGNNVVGIAKAMLFFPKEPIKSMNDSSIYKEYEFDKYKLTAYYKTNCDESYLDHNYYAESTDSFNLIKDGNVNLGNKFLHADLRYKNYDKSDYDLESWTKAGIQITDIGESPGKYCYSYNPNPLYNFKLETTSDGKTACSIETADYAGALYEGNDLKTWNKDSGDNSCADSKTWLQCPGIKVYYCGKTSYDTYPEREDEYPDWRAVKDDAPRIETYFVEVRNDEHTEAYHIHSKTSFKFLVELDSAVKNQGKSVERDNFYKKWVSDSFSYAKTRIVSSGVKGEKAYPFYYSISPSFNVQFDTGISDYNGLRDNSEKLIEQCNGNITKLSVCIKDYIQKNNLNYKSNINGNIAEFDVPSSRTIITQEGNKAVLKPVTYKFALAFK